MWGKRLELYSHEPRDTCSPQQLKEAIKDSPLELSEKVHSVNTFIADIWPI